MVNGWRKASIGRLGKVVTGTTPSTVARDYYGGDIPFISPSDLGKSLFVDRAERTLTPAGFKQAKAVPPGSILFTCIGATIGKAAIAGRELATNQQINAVICDPQEADSTFVYYLLSLRADHIKRLASAQAIPIVNKSTFEAVTAPVPPLAEQRKIAEILRTWDEAIEKLEALHAAKHDGLTALRQRLIGIGRSFRESWELRPLSDFSTRIRRRNGGNNHPVMTISAKSGFLMQSDKYSRNMAGKSVENYTVLHEGRVCL